MLILVPWHLGVDSHVATMAASVLHFAFVRPQLKAQITTTMCGKMSGVPFLPGSVYPHRVLGYVLNHMTA